MNNKYSKASLTGFLLILLSVFVGMFFILNDGMLHTLGRGVFDALFYPMLICLFLTHIAGFVLSIIGLKKVRREKLKGKGFSIAAIVIFVVESVVIVFCYGFLLVIMIGKRGPAQTDNITFTATETTTKETKEPAFYENNEHLIFLKNNINEKSSLSEIIDVFEKMSKEPSGNQDRVVFEAGASYCLKYDYYAGGYVDAGYHYCFSLKRWFKAEDGEMYQIRVNVMYKPGDEDYEHREEAMSIDVYDNVNESFFDDVRNSKAYRYVSAREIERIDIFMGPRQ